MPETPTAVMGLQVMPTSAVTSCTTTPRSARSADAAAESACWALLQHCREPVLHWLDGELVGVLRRAGVAVAAARVASASAETAVSWENCMLILVE